MKPQIRTYILVVGRDADDQPYRALAPYRVPMPSLTDHFEDMSNAQIRQAKHHLKAELEFVERALEDLEHESLTRLEKLS